jgi:arylsulfatase A-like enzyme
MKTTVIPFVALTLLAALPIARAADRPNILWLTSEDHGPQLGCYGDPVARTPNVDALAAKGMLFKRAWSNAPVCAAARTTIITGLFAPALGAEHMRSEVAMPAGLRMYPQYLREAGYYCTNNSKEDYNLTKPGQVWDESSGTAHWRKRAAGQPFFAIFNSTASHESQVIKRPHQAITDPARVRVPAYHPDTPEVRRDWAQYHDQVSEVDAAAGAKLKELAEAGLADDTIVFYYADHGPGMPRSKRWPSNSGLHVPLVVHFPAKWRHLAPKEYAPGAKSERLVSFVDLAPTLLSIVGIKPPATMHGFAFAGPYQTDPQPYLYGFRGRMDERYDLVRSLTDGRYVYLRNYMPHRSQAQHVNTQFKTPTTQVWRRLFDQGKANDAQSIFWREPKAPEELYDLAADPDETRNLAGSAAHQATLEQLRRAQQAYAARVRDTGFLSEAEVHARAGAKSPRDVLATEAAYPFARVFAAADTATLMRPEALPQLSQYLKDRDSGVRYWGAMGALMRGRSAVDALKRELSAALGDASPSVRIAAAEALLKHGDAADAAPALAALKECADPTKSGAYAATAALNTIDELGAKAAPLHDFIRTMPTTDPQVVARASGYVARLQEYILGLGEPAPEGGAEQEPKKKRARKTAK